MQPLMLRLEFDTDYVVYLWLVLASMHYLLHTHLSLKYSSTYLCINTLVMRPPSTSAGSVSTTTLQPPPRSKKRKKTTSSKCALCNLCPSIKQFGCWQFEQTSPRSMWKYPVVCGNKKNKNKATSHSGVDSEWKLVAFNNKLRSF